MSGLSGHLELVCAADEAGRVVLRHQSFSTPFHLSKPYTCEAGVLTVQLVNPTAGLFSGDRLTSRVRVERCGRLRLTSPSASRPHTMTEGRALAEQGFEVCGGGWLDYFPAPLIPQTGSRYRQQTRIDLEPGGEMFFLEIVTPGRVARGEVFAFAELDWDAELRVGSVSVARERFTLRPVDGALPGFQNLYPHPYFASGYLVTARLSESDTVWDEVRAIQGPDCIVGASCLGSGVWGLRIVARDSVAMRAAAEGLRQRLGTRIPELSNKPRG